MTCVDDLGGSPAVRAEAVSAVPREERRGVGGERGLVGRQLGGRLAETRRVPAPGLSAGHFGGEQGYVARQTEEDLRAVRRPQQQPPSVDPHAAFLELKRPGAGIGAACSEPVRVAPLTRGAVELGA
jgi:hypothetical protein